MPNSYLQFHHGEFDPIRCVSWVLMPPKATDWDYVPLIHETISHPMTIVFDTEIGEMLTISYLEHEYLVHERLLPWIQILEAIALANVYVSYPLASSLASRGQNQFIMTYAHYLVLLRELVVRIGTSRPEVLSRLPRSIKDGLEFAFANCPGLGSLECTGKYTVDIEFLFAVLLCRLEFKGKSFANLDMLRSLCDNLEEALGGSPIDSSAPIWKAEPLNVIFPKFVFILAMCDRILDSENPVLALSNILAHLAMIRRHFVGALVGHFVGDNEIDWRVRVLQGHMLLAYSESAVTQTLSRFSTRPELSTSAHPLAYLRESSLDELLLALKDKELDRQKGVEENAIVALVIRRISDALSTLCSYYRLWKKDTKCVPETCSSAFNELEQLASGAYTPYSWFWRQSYERALRFLNRFQEDEFVAASTRALQLFIEPKPEAEHVLNRIATTLLDGMKESSEEACRWMFDHYLWQEDAFSQYRFQSMFTINSG